MPAFDARNGGSARPLHHVEGASAVCRLKPSGRDPEQVAQFPLGLGEIGD